MATQHSVRSARHSHNRAGLTGFLPRILAAMLIAPVMAFAANSPQKLNVESGCKAAAAINQAMNLSVAQNYKNCMDDEDAARQQLVQSWSSFTAQDQARCVGQTQINGMPSYVEVLSCLQVTTKLPLQANERRNKPDTKGEDAGEKTSKPDTNSNNTTKPTDLKAITEALRADATQSAMQIAELEKKNAELNETASSLKTSLVASAETITQLKRKNSDSERALEKLEHERFDVESRLHNLEQAAAAKRVAGDGDAGRYWKDVAYVTCGGFIALVVLNASYFWLRGKRAKRAATCFATVESNSLGWQDEGGRDATAGKPSRRPITVAAQQGVARASYDTVLNSG